MGGLLGIRSVNASTVPVAGATIVAPNHVSMLDPLHALAVTDRPLRPLAKAGLFEVPVLRSVLRSVGAIPVEHGNAATALRNARTVLDGGNAMLVYPQGMLLHSNAPGAHAGGVAQLATETGASVTPLGSYGAGPRVLRGAIPNPGARVPRHPMISLAFGDPIPAPRADTPFNRGVLHERVARAQDELVAKAHEHYDARVAAAEARRPYVLAGTALAGAGALGGAAWLASRR